MAELVPVPFETLVRRALEEFAQSRSIFDLPEKSFFRPDPALDLSVSFQGRSAGTPVGPASGPHTQLVQNLVLSWLGGGRVFELKTVQVNDRLTIPRPCIHVPNLGYNVEWSQELRIEESLREYVGGAMLIEILAAAGVAGPRPTGTRGAHQLDLSLGYSLEGIRSAPVRRFVERMKNAHAEVETLRARIPAEHARWRDLPFPTALVHNVTLSTFHGCPADEIESIVNCLLTEMDLDVVVKMNPTLIGREKAEWLMHEVMGYRDVRMNSVAFERDISFAAATAMVRRQQAVARARGRRLGVKMSNTLEVLNAGGPFAEKVLYLSGQPLHVLTMNILKQVRDALGPELPISFSAGIDAQNFARAVSCNLIPVTTCTDLLRPGGYGRLPLYITNLETEMERLGVRCIGDFVIRVENQGEESARLAVGELREALLRTLQRSGSEAQRARLQRDAQEFCATLERRAFEAVRGSPFQDLRSTLGAVWRTRPESLRAILRPGQETHDLAQLYARIVEIAGGRNTDSVVERTSGDPRYAAERNRRVPRKIGSRLVLYDCINCDKCVPVCPNDANFVYTAETQDFEYEDYVVENGALRAVPGGRFVVEKSHQLANYADFCNECGNCDVFCPEDGGPYVEKPRFFSNLDSWSRDRQVGFYARAGVKDSIWGRFSDGREHFLHLDRERGEVRFKTCGVEVDFDLASHRPRGVRGSQGPAPEGTRVDMRVYHALRTLLCGILAGDSVHFVNVPHT